MSRTLKGIVLMGVLLGIAVLVFFLEDIVHAFDNRYTVYVVMGAAPGLGEGSPVWVSGNTVGVVRQVAFMPAGDDTLARIAVALNLPRRVQAQVRGDSDVRVTSASLIGEAVVDIGAGSAAAPVLGDGDTLYMRPGPTAAQLTAQAGRVRADLDTVLATMRTLAPTVEARLADTRRAFSGLDAAMAEARRLGTDLERSPGRALLADAEFRASVDRTRAHAAGLSELVAAWRGRAGDRAEVNAALGRLGVRVDSLRSQLDGIAAVLDAQEGFLGRWQRDTAITRAMNAARADLDSLVAESRRNPLRYIF